MFSDLEIRLQSNPTKLPRLSNTRKIYIFLTTLSHSLHLYNDPHRLISSQPPLLPSPCPYPPPPHTEFSSFSGLAPTSALQRSHSSNPLVTSSVLYREIRISLLQISAYEPISPTLLVSSMFLRAARSSWVFRMLSSTIVLIILPFLFLSFPIYCFVAFTRRNHTGRGEQADKKMKHSHGILWGLRIP